MEIKKSAYFLTLLLAGITAVSNAKVVQPPYPTLSSGLRYPYVIIVHPDGRFWKSRTNPTRELGSGYHSWVGLNSGSPSLYTIGQGSDIGLTSGWFALYRGGSTDAAVRHAWFLMYEGEFSSNNLDFAWNFKPVTSSDDETLYWIYDAWDDKHVVGYDVAQERVNIVPISDKTATPWRIFPACPLGQYLKNNKACVPCPPGTFKDTYVAYGDMNVCTPCPVNTFSDAPGSTFCRACGTNEATVGKNSTTCVCDAGFTRDKNDFCQRCLRGTGKLTPSDGPCTDLSAFVSSAESTALATHDGPNLTPLYAVIVVAVAAAVVAVFVVRQRRNQKASAGGANGENSATTEKGTGAITMTQGAYPVLTRTGRPLPPTTSYTYYTEPYSQVNAVGLPAMESQVTTTTVPKTPALPQTLQLPDVVLQVPGRRASSSSEKGDGAAASPLGNFLYGYYDKEEDHQAAQEKVPTYALHYNNK